MRVLVVSTYELGNQPLGLGKPAAVLRHAGHEVRCVDVAVDRLTAGDVDWADRIAFSVPMHTAMRLAQQVACRVRKRRPELPVCFFGLYATVSGDRTVISAADAAIAGEYEPSLMAWVNGSVPGTTIQLGRADPVLPDRSTLPDLDRYTHLAMGGEERLVGSVEASRGCSHHCRHCPVPVVYAGRVRPMDEATIVADVDQLVAAGIRHVTFSDPDFLNMPRHSQRTLDAIHLRHPDLTFDCTVKVEHVLRHRGMWESFAAEGCLFIVSAFESVDELILGILDKGHSVADASDAVVLLRSYGIEIRPSWLPFTPWTTIDGLVDLFDFVIAHDLIANVDPVQFTIRLLVPEGSLLLDRAEMAPHLGGYDPDRLGWTWTHPDPAVDQLQADLAELTESRMGDDDAATFDLIDALVRDRAGADRARPDVGVASRGPAGARPRLTEAWFCCSEPTEAQQAPLLPPLPTT